MRLFPRIHLSALVAVATALAWPADVARASAREPVLDESPASATVFRLPRFTLFGWVSPPLEHTTPGRYAEMASVGFTLTLPAWNDSGRAADNLERLATSRPLGLQSLILDNDLDSVSVRTEASIARVDTIVARYRNDPAFFGYYLGDEPPASWFPGLAVWHRLLRASDPAHPPWNNLLPLGAFQTNAEFEAYLRQYVSWTHPAVLCNSQYDFCTTGDANHLTRNIATLSAIARENRIPFWGVVQLTEHGWFRHVGEGVLRYQVAQWLAWGASGVGYFTYWTPAPDPFYDWQPAMIEWGTGARTAYYDIVKAINGHTAPIGNTLAGMTWRATRHAGSVPDGGVAFVSDTVLAAVEGRATLGYFTDSTGTPCVLLANADSLTARTLTLRTAGGRGVWRLRADGSFWDPLVARPDGRFALALAPGDFVLLRLPVGIVVPVADVGPQAAGAVPRLGLHPNPARGAVRLAVAEAGGPARVAVLDLEGRVVWTRPLAAGAAGATWSGERDAGGRARAGVYFARLETRHGTIVRRLAWLGGR